MCFFFFFKQKTAYEMRISDWSSDVCSSDLAGRQVRRAVAHRRELEGRRRRGAGHGGDRGLVERLVGVVDGDLPAAVGHQIGRASCRERVCQYVEVSVVAVSLKKKNKT